MQHVSGQLQLREMGSQLRPDKTTNQVFLYCLAEAAQRFGIRVILSAVESNHHRTIVYERDGTIIEFMGHLHKLVAKALNAYRGRCENFFAAEEPCLVQLFGAEDLLDKLVYAATNPVKDGLVAKVSEWPGINTLSALLAQQTITVERPSVFFRPNGGMPSEVQLKFAVPEEIMRLDEISGFLSELGRRVADVEGELAIERTRSGRQVMGRQRALRQSWRNSPTSKAPRRQLRPRVAAREIWRRVMTLQRNQEFQLEYRTARKAWLAGFDVLFPAGTYWLSRFATVAVAPYDGRTAPRIFELKERMVRSACRRASSRRGQKLLHSHRIFAHPRGRVRCGVQNLINSGSVPSYVAHRDISVPRFRHGGKGPPSSPSACGRAECR